MPVDPVSQPTMPQVPEEFSGRDLTKQLDQDAFLKILVAQLRNQDPMSPMEDRDFIAQMAQFSTLEQMQSLNQGMSFSQATSLVGRNVYAEYQNESGGVEKIFGTVTSVMSMRGQPFLEVEGKYVPYTQDVIVYDYGDDPGPPAETDSEPPDVDALDSPAESTASEEPQGIASEIENET